MGSGRRARTKASVAIAFVVVLGLMLPAAASAAETIGQTAPPSSCTAGEAYTQGVLTSGTSYSPSAPGVITSWSSFAGSLANTQIELLVLKPNPSAGATHFIATQRDQVRSLAQPSALNTFSGVRLPIEAGDRIGMFLPSIPGAGCFFNVGGADTGLFYGGDPPLNVDSDFTGSNSSRRLNASAVVEPDADHDGFGDETQDACPSSAAAQGACPAAHKKRCKKHKKKHRDAQAAKKKTCKKKR